MTANEIVNTVLNHRVMLNDSGLTVAQKTDAIKNTINMTVNEIATSYEWDFSTDTNTDTTVADQAEYTLKGKANNCQTIINIFYNDTTHLQKLSAVNADEFLSDRTVSGVGWWCPAGRASGGFPKVKIIATPEDTGENLTYRYFRKNVQLAEIPDQYDYVVILGVLKNLYPDFKYQFDRAVKKMIASYNQEGNDVMQARLDPETKKRNNKMAGLYGW